MKGKQKYLLGILSAVCMIMIILDSKTALVGAASGIELCIKTVIPALFPFFFLTGIITDMLNQPLRKIFRPIGKLYKIPAGAESTLILGLLGGYPIGAQAVHNLYQAGYLNKNAARRMLPFCNNPGPAFIFGMIGCLFDSIIVPWVIWCIIILSSFMTSLISPASNDLCCNTVFKEKTGFLEASIKAMAKVCGWVILFRVLLTFLQRWILWLFPPEITIFITGLLELTNGCISLLSSANIVFRFCCATVMLSFGGICVTMQTVGIAGDLISKQYFMGKLFQMFVSLPLSYIAAKILFSLPLTFTGILIAMSSLCIAIFIGYLLRKNNTGNHKINVI